MRRLRRALATGLAASAALLTAAGPAAQAQHPATPVGYHAAMRGHSGHGHGHGHYCPPPHYSYPHAYSPYYAPHDAQAPTEAPRDDMAPTEDQTPDATPDAAPDAAPTPSFASVSGATGTPSAPASAAPNAIGDFFGNVASSHAHGPCLVVSPGGSSNTVCFNPAASVVGKVKATENNSPIPTDRFFFDYTVYNNVPLQGGFFPDTDVQRYVPGFERTVLDGMASVEVRMPVARTLDTTLVAGEANDGDSWEAGNLYVAAKTLLYQDDVFAFTAGLGISTPTGSDTELIFPATTGVVENQAVHLLPYFGMLHTPNDTFYSQTYVQVDVDANGNPIIIDGDRQGVVQDQTLLFADFILGAWLWDDPCSTGLTGVVGTTEVHYTTAIQDYDTFETATTELTATAMDDFDFLTGIVGVHFLYAGGAQVTFAYGVPLLSQRFADSEFRMMFNLGSPFGAIGNLAGVPR